MKVHAVLLVPAEGDPHGLLADGPCGARPPVVYRSRGCGVGHPDTWQPHDEFVRRGECYMCDYPEEALVLAWNGKPVPEGIERSVPVVRSRAWIEYLVGCALGHITDDVGGLSWSDGTALVLLDAEGREVSDG